MIDKTSVSNCFKRNFIIVLCLLGLILLTQETSFDLAYLSSIGYADSSSYWGIATCFDNQNCDILNDLFPQLHIYRWIPHVLLGLASSSLNLSLEILYISLSVGLFFFCGLLVLSFDKRINTSISYLFLLMLNPYSFRLFFLILWVFATLFSSVL